MPLIMSPRLPTILWIAASKINSAPKMSAKKAKKAMTNSPTFFMLPPPLSATLGFSGSVIILSLELIFDRLQIFDDCLKVVVNIENHRNNAYYNPIDTVKFLTSPYVEQPAN